MILVIDAIMGGGKTSWAHSQMRYHHASGHDLRFMYIAPYLTELTRLRDTLPELGFEEPTDNAKHRSKFLSLKGLVRDNANIASTHALFTYFDNELYALVRKQPYVLVIDETLPVVEKYKKCTKPDFEMLLRDEKVEIGPDNRVQWNYEKWPAYQGKFEDVRKDCDAGILVCVKGSLLIWQFPIKFLDAFAEIWVLTYLFEGSLMSNYLKAHGKEYRLETVASDRPPGPGADYWLTPYDSLDNIQKKRELSKLISICEDDDLNAVGAVPRLRHKGEKALQPLSKNWFTHYGIPKGIAGLRGWNGISQLKNNCQTYIRYRAPTPSSKVMWTTFKPFSGQLKGKGYARSFVRHNAKATNEYRTRETLIYAMNRFLDPDVEAYFRDMGLEARENLFALSELMQWIFRSRIREGRPISIYIPSERMRWLLNMWLSHSDRDIIYGRVLDEGNVREAA